MRSTILDPGPTGVAPSIGLLLLRLGAGPMLAFGHGWGKLVAFADKAATFPDPLHIGHRASMACTIGAELFCSLLVALGLGTRPAAAIAAFTMGVAAFVVHAGAPFARRELALAYLLPFLGLVFTGAGRFSVDARIRGRGKR